MKNGGKTHNQDGVSRFPETDAEYFKQGVSVFITALFSFYELSRKLAHYH